MAKIKIQGHASGTGVLTVTAPNTSTDRTITLPDGTGTLLTTDGDGSSLTGTGSPSITDNGNATAITIDASENVGIGTSSPQHLLETSQSSSSKVIGLTLQNSMNTNSSTTGVGIKFKGSSYSDADETRKWAGIYGIANDTYHNKMGLSFYTNNDRTQEPTEKLQITSDGRGLSQFTAKVWCLFDGNGSIHDSHNITSVDDDGLGLNELHFANALGNIKFSCVTSSGRYTSDTDRLLRAMTESNTRLRTTSSIAFHISYSDSTNQDGLYASALIFGD